MTEETCLKVTASAVAILAMAVCWFTIYVAGGGVIILKLMGVF